MKCGKILKKEKKNVHHFHLLAEVKLRCVVRPPTTLKTVDQVFMYCGQFFLSQKEEEKKEQASKPRV